MTDDTGVSFRQLSPADAPALKACFERCYGTSYVVGDFYNVGALKTRIEQGRLRSIISVADSGEIVGHMGLSLRHEGAKTVDAGNTIVDPRFRGRHLVARLGVALSEMCRDQGFYGYHHYPTTAHPIMQKLSVSSGGIETGLMLEYIPSGTEYREFEGAPSGERLAVTVVYQPLNPAPSRALYLPPEYDHLLRAVIEKSDLHRTIVSEAAQKPMRVPGSSIRVVNDPRRGLFRLECPSLGEDLFDRVDVALSETDADVVQIDLPLHDPLPARLIREMRKRQFVFCAWMPEYFEGDILRLQRLPRAAFRRPEIVNPGAQAIAEFIVHEAEGIKG